MAIDGAGRPVHRDGGARRARTTDRGGAGDAPGGHPHGVASGAEPIAFDPARAALLRVARRLGFALVAFDFPTEGYGRAALRRLMHRAPVDAATMNRERERDVATNIVRRVLLPDPAARVVIWTGEQHALRRTPVDWSWQHPFMAALLAEMTGETPYCVWQECVDWPVLGAGPQLLHGNHPRLVALGVDAIVFHHRGATPARPAWLDRDTDAVDLATAGAALVQAIPASEGERAVPATQLLAHGADHVSLYLPYGSYIVRGLRGNDRVEWRRTNARSRI